MRRHTLRQLTALLELGVSQRLLQKRVIQHFRQVGIGVRAHRYLAAGGGLGDG